MFRGGSYWKPPVMNPYTQGMPDDLVEGGTEIPVVPKVEEEVVPQQKKGKLTDRYPCFSELVHPWEAILPLSVLLPFSMGICP